MGIWYIVNNLLPLGQNLRKARKRYYPRDTLADFALRIGVSRATLQKMEQGDLSVALGKYYGAADLLGLTQPFEQLLHVEEGLFDD